MKVVIGICFVCLAYHGVNAIDCGNPTTANGITSFDNTTYGSLANISCDQGYTLIDENNFTIYCQDDGQWSSTPVCVQGCDNPPIEDQLSYDERTYLSNISLICVNDGYNLRGTPYIICQTNGSWTEMPLCYRIDCGSPAPLQNGMIEYDTSTFYEDFITVTCNTGYKAPCGRNVFHCAADGNWTYLNNNESIACSSDADCPQGNNFTCNSASECECPSSYLLHINYCIYDCGDPPGFEVNGINLTYTLQYDNGLEGDIVYYICPDGYDMSGADIGVCETGGWTDVLPVCLRDCGNLPAITNGNLTLDDAANTTVGNTATVSCTDGYTENTASITCLDTGQWEVANCTLIECDELIVTNGNLNDSVRTYGTVVGVDCNEGYVIREDAVIECRVDGSWSGVPNCDPIDCGELSILNGGVSSINTTYSTEIYVDCFEGYDVSNPFAIICQSNGNWSDVPTCDPVDCGELSVTNGILNDSVTTFGTVVKVNCNTGYINSSNTPLVCEADGNWSGNLSCEPVDCGELSILNGGVSSINTTYGTEIYVDCFEGYDVSNPFAVTCQSNGNWSNVPTCDLVDCGELSVTNGILNDSVTTFGTVVEVNCNTGYINSSNTPLVCEADGNWSGNLSCEPVDCGELSILNGGVSSSNTTYGTEIYVDCFEGYDVSNPFAVTCQSNGNWSDVPTCDPVDCGALSVTNGILNDSVTTFGTVVKVNCNTGYIDSSNTPLVCEADGIWSGNLSCEPVDCSELSILNGGVSSSNTTYGTEIYIDCFEGYDVSNPFAVICQSNGNWSDVPTCDPVDCGELSVTNGILNDSVTTFGTVVKVNCNTGYIDSSNTPLVCEADGIWSGNLSCEPVDCGELSILNGGVSSSNTTYGTEIYIDCFEGYDVSNPFAVICQSNGNWSDVPTCDPVDCGSEFNISNSWVTLNNETDTTFGTSANVECHYGYETNVTTIYCQSSGEWDTTVCTRIDCGPVPEILHSNTTLDVERETKLNDRATVKCDTGYAMEINNYLYKVFYVYCRGSGTWDNRTCTISDCGLPPNDTLNGEFILDEEGVTTYGANATLTCIKGYESSNPVITCEELDTWSTYEPCLIKDCNTVPVIEFGTIMPIDDGNTTYGAVANVTCDYGYNASKEQIQCLSNGTWESVTCEKIDCGLVPEVLNGNTTLSFEGYTQLGERAVVECDIGYHINGTFWKFDFIYCTPAGTWENRTCDFSDCISPPNDTLNGEFILDEEGVTTYGANATLTCVKGYESSNPVITCEELDTWSTYEPCLIKVCGDVPLINGGRIDLQEAGNSSYGAIADVVCDTGYNTTLDTIQCLDTGEWENATCTVVDCGDVPFINNGNIVLQEEGNSSYGALAKVTCNIGYNTTSDTIQCLDTGELDNATCTIVDCGDVPVINDGSIILQESGNSSYGALAEVTCNTGYNATLNTIVCQDTGEWENITCNIIDCGNVPSVLNGSIELVEDGNTTYGALAEVICDTGYNKSRDILECHNTGEWDKPTCDLIDCGTVPLINGGSIILNQAGNISYGALAEVRCNTGYNTTLPTIECGDNGKWDNTTCDIVDCGNVPLISNGSITLIEDGNTTYGALAEVTCETGYNETLNIIECRNTGDWDATDCNLIDCGTVPLINGGSITLNQAGNSSYGALAEVRCNTGYNTTLPTIECGDNGKWDNTTCDIVDCGNVPLISNGSITLIEDGNTTYGALAEVTCETGYNETLNIIECRNTGDWDATDCNLIDCGTVPLINGGSITLNQAGNSSYGALAEVRCNTGYNTTLPTIECGDNGKWDNTTCDIVDCGNVPLISNGSITLIEDGNTTYGALAEVTCETGYNETLNIIECRNTGDWDATDCNLIDCGTVPQLDNGNVVLKVDGLSSYGSEAVVTCEQGYNTTSETIQCLDTGKWDNTSCEIVDCGEVPVVTKGTITLLEENNTTYTALANVSCEPGYNASKGIIQCLETGLWEITECQILDCDAVPDFLNGIVALQESENTTYGKQAEVICNSGYNATSETILCLETGKWETPQCKILDCEAVPIIANGQITLTQDGNTTHGAIASVSCLTGYNATVDTILCLDTGEWDNATCNSIDCGNLPSISNGSIALKEDGNTTYGALAEVTCDTGYNETLNIIECRDTGDWDVTGCNLIDCGNVPLLDNGNVVLKVDGLSSYGTEAVVTCEQGYNATSETIQCLDTGKWDNISCELVDCGEVPVVTKGTVTLLEENNTTYSALANVSCETGYNASIGIIQCLETGLWETTECQILDCEAVPDVLNGIVALQESENTTYGKQAEVICNSGYNATSETILCLETGKWETPQCEILDCEAVPIIANGQITRTQDGNTTYGAIANVSCSIGYNATVDTILCLDTGEWDNATCYLIDCGTVPEVVNGNVALLDVVNTTYGALADITCETGYNSSLDSIQCRETGVWDTASCDLINCGNVSVISNGDITLIDEGNTTYGALAEVTCNTGYNKSIDIIKCHDTGEWDVPACYLIDCGDVPTISNGTIYLKEEENTTYGALAEVVCENGYNETLDIIECRNTGEWDAVECYLIDCGILPSIDNGSIALTDDGNSSFGALAEVTCNIGHNATLETIMCRDTGKWDNTSCEIINCGDVPTISNGTIDLKEVGNTTYGAIAEVVCEHGFNETLDIIECRDTGEWDVVRCYLIDCGILPSIDNGSIALNEDGNSSFGALAEVTCTIGHNATLETIMCRDTGKWDNTSCEIINCGDVPTVIKGSVTLLEENNTTYSALANVSCDTGYNASIGIIQCLETGQWQTTECQLLDCESIPMVLNGVVALIEAENTTYGQLAEVTCNKGYNSTSGTIKCLETGKWETPQCELLNCEAVPVIANGQVTLTQDGNTTYGAIANVSCSTGYNATVDTILCLDTGEWDNTTCTLIDCSVAPKVSNGNVALLEENTTYGALAEITCETGYNFSVPTIQCRDTGVWDTATCDLIVCEPSPTIENGKVNLQEEGNYSFGAIARIDCDTGYTASITAIQCRENGTWDTTICSIIDCGRLDDLMNGNINTSNGTTYGSTATYTCDEGLDIIGDVTRICDANGKWSKTKPDCLPKGAKRCPENTDKRGTVWNAIAGGRNRSNPCPTNFTGTVNRQCRVDGNWKFPQYICIRESVNKVLDKIDLLNKDTPQQDVLNALQGLNNVTMQAEIIAEQDKLTDFEVSSLITSTGTVADILSSSPTLINKELTDVFTESISNLIDEKNSGSWNALTQTSSKVAEKMLSSVDTLSNAMAKRVNSSGISLPAVVKPNIALHVKAVSSNNFVFPGSDAVEGTSSDNWIRATKSQIDFNTTSFGGASQQSVVSAAIYKDISNILPNKSNNEQLNGQVLSFSTLPPLSGTIDPPITMSFYQTNEQLTRATCSFWKFGNSGSGAWATEGCTGRSISKGLTECKCSHTTNFAVILSLQDCGGFGSIANGEIDNSAGTKYKATAKFRCNAGYAINGANTSTCLYNGSWSSPVPSCSVKDCGNLSNPLNGNVLTPEGTTFDNEAVYSCDNGYNLNGTETRLCLLNGSWSSTAPTCVKEVQTPKTCKQNVDSRGLTWPETISGNPQNKRCQSGFTGSISRTCGAGGVWNLPQYNCVRDSIVKVNEKVSTLSKNATGDEVNTVLEEILKVTTVNETTDNNTTLTDGELSVLSSSLETVADVLANSSGIINENITNEFLEIASNLVDDSNQESWKSLSQSENNDESARVLKAVDSLAVVLSNSIEDGPENGTLIVKKNIAIDVKKVSNKGVSFPDPDKTVSDKDDANADWFKQARSSLRLEAAALKNTSVQYATTAVMYRDLSKILPNKRNNTNNNAEDTDDVINAPILSLTISPPVSDKLDPPLQLNFTHDMTNFSNPLCSYWAFPNGKIGQGFWSSEGCIVKTTNTNYTICQCDHLTNFAVLMSPFVEADAASKALRIISIAGIGISIACLTVTLIVHIFFWKYLRNDRTTALVNLCVALLLSYILFLAGVDRTESSVACAVIAAVLQYIYLVVFCIMLVEGIEIAITVLYVFKTKSRIRIMLIFAWVIPAIIVGISLGATQAKGYGNDNFCWLSVENGLIWSFVGPALCIIIFNGICLIIVIRIMFKTKAMETKTVSEKIKTSFRSLCVLVPVMGVSWILGIFYVNDSFYFIQYIFAILNGLQGFFIFLFHCLLNEQVKKAIQLRNRRRSSVKETLKSTLRSTSKDERKSKDLKESRKSFIDSGDFTTRNDSDGWKDKIINTQYPSPDVKFATPLGFYGNGRRAATFSVESRDKLTGHVSKSASNASQKSSGHLEANLFSARL